MRTTPKNNSVLRKKKYLDHTIQGWMISLMLFSQLAFLIAGISLFYLEFSELIDHHLYSIHSLDMEAISDEVSTLSGKISFYYLAMNMIGLILMHYLWVNYITRVLTEFIHLSDKTRSLDFSDDEMESSHLVNDAAKAWRTEKRKKWVDVIKQINSLPDDEKMMAEKKQQLVADIQDIRQRV